MCKRQIEWSEMFFLFVFRSLLHYTLLALIVNTTGASAHTRASVRRQINCLARCISRAPSGRRRPSPLIDRDRSSRASDDRVRRRRRGRQSTPGSDPRHQTLAGALRLVAGAWGRTDSWAGAAQQKYNRLTCLHTKTDDVRLDSSDWMIGRLAGRVRGCAHHLRANVSLIHKGGAVCVCVCAHLFIAPNTGNHNNNINH